ncbi:hypothetical protein BGZ72_007119 [Mortierella alpina]|nr:hypothetical protein BGZ72_007119 [Mortierella alpina]
MRRNQDPIAEHSARLCEYMNSRPTIVLSYARYFGEYPEATTATMTSVDQDGFDLLCLDQGQEQEVRVTFSHSLHAPSQVRDALTDLAKEAETALRGNDPDSQGAMPDSPSVTFPDIDAFTAVLIMAVMVAFYLDFFPNTKSPLLQWVLQTAGSSAIHYVVQLVLGAHVIESLFSLYLTVVVGQGFFQPVDVLQWFLAVFIFGYASLFKLFTLAYRQQAIARSGKNKTD